MKKVVLAIMLMFSAGLIVSCGSDKEAEGEKTEEQAKKDSEDSDKDKKECSKDHKCCKDKGKMCESRKALEEALSDDEKTTIADARNKIKEVVGDTIYMMMSHHMCDAGGKCCGTSCKKDGKKCEHKEGEHKEGKKCDHKEGKKCCKHGHGMMGMMMDIDSTQMQEWHDALMPTIESLVAITEAHSDHFEEVKALHAKKMEHMKEHMAECRADSTKATTSEMKKMHDKMNDPEHMEQMMIVHYLLMDPSKCKKGSCKKSDSEGEEEEGEE